MLEAISLPLRKGWSYTLYVSSSPPAKPLSIPWKERGKKERLRSSLIWNWNFQLHLSSQQKTPRCERWKSGTKNVRIIPTLLWLKSLWSYCASLEERGLGLPRAMSSLTSLSWSLCSFDLGRGKRKSKGCSAEIKDKIEEMTHGNL